MEETGSERRRGAGIEYQVETLVTAGGGAGELQAGIKCEEKLVRGEDDLRGKKRKGK